MVRLGNFEIKPHVIAITTVYRSPNSTPENNTRIIDFVEPIADKWKDYLENRGQIDVIYTDIEKNIS